IVDGLNSGEETDRVVVRWELASDRAVAAADGAPPAQAAGVGRVILRADPDGAPAVSDADGDRLLAWIPGDIGRLRQSDAALAHAWRRALRATVGRCLSGGFSTGSITRDGWFVLTR